MDEIPVIDLGDGEARPPRKRAVRAARFVVPVLVVTLVGAAAIATARVAGDHGRNEKRVNAGPDRVRTDDGVTETRVDVEAALAQTAAADSYAITYETSESSAVTYAAQAVGLTITGHGTVSVKPLGIMTVAGVGGYGNITTRYDGTNVWETGGGNYGTGGDATGAPLSQFAGLVLGTLGRREGAVAMNSLATPTGYLTLARESITSASAFGKSTVDGEVVTVYSVDVDWLRATGIERTPEQTIAAAAAAKALEAEGYTGTTMRVSVDGNGFIRRTETTAHFADGGTVQSDTTFSNFGCYTLLPGPHGPDFAPNPAHCAG